MHNLDIVNLKENVVTSLDFDLLFANMADLFDDIFLDDSFVEGEYHRLEGSCSKPY